MASKRRGGFRPPELRGTLGTLIRTTTGVVRDAIERGAREGRARLDDARAGRRRQDALADLGELVLDLIRRGEIDLAELPEARDLVRQLDELDADDANEPEPPPRTVRRRPAERDADRTDRTAPDDGTVSSGVAARAARPTTYDRPRPETSSMRTPTRPMKPSWRPTVDDAPAIPVRPDRPDRPTRPTVPDRPSRPTVPDRPDLLGHKAGGPDPAPLPEPRRPPLPRDPKRPGGISFDDDDLADYMHPDDVPAKEPGDGSDP
jgi:hypothetical protein